MFMKISLIGPGYGPIPPTGHGAVESLICDYEYYLKKFGCDVQIVNEIDLEKSANLVNSFNPDFVHIHLDDIYKVADLLHCKNIAITCHDPWVQWPKKRDWNRPEEYNAGMFNFKGYIFALNDYHKHFYIKNGFPEDKIFITPNGANKEFIRFNNTPKFNKSICVAKIEYRKNQPLLMECNIQYNTEIYFAGNGDDERIKSLGQYYVGHWNKNDVYNITEYSNLVLLSHAEAAPLVCLEALMAGLGLVITNECTSNLDTTLPFIDIIPSNKLKDLKYINDVIVKNKEISTSMRSDIRKYAEEFLSWEPIVKRYYNLIKNKIIKQ
jgi:glycosyltransferase involved in cell wall biosynthesis